MKNDSGDKREARCLIVDDDPVATELIRHSLASHSYTISSVATGEEAIAACRRESIDVLLLDYSLPGISGEQVCRSIREFSDAYILMVSANNNEAHRVLTLALGADDYITKPFSPSELCERVRAVLRRPRYGIAMHSVNAPERRSIKRIGDLTIDTYACLAATEDGYIDFTQLEFTLLAILAEGSPQTVSRKEIFERVWQRSHTQDDHIVDVHISNIRSKIRSAGLKDVRIKSVRAYGYRIVPESIN